MEEIIELMVQMDFPKKCGYAMSHDMFTWEECQKNSISELATNVKKK